MWKRVHLAAIDGPDPGNTVELGATGRGLPDPPGVSVGRGELVDHQILDPHLSRHHFHARAGSGRLGGPGAWITDAGGERHVRIGGRYRAGRTTFEVRTDARPRRFSGRSLVKVLPLAAALGLVAMWIIPGAGPWPLLFTAVATPAGMAVANSRGSPPLPDPARLYRQREDPPPPAEGGGTQRSWRVETGDVRRRGSLEVAPGQTLGIAGGGAAGLGRWVSAQLVAAGARVEVETADGLLRFTLTPPDGADITVLAAHSPGLLPPGVSHVLPAPAGHNRRVGERWFSAFCAHAGGGALPDAAPLAPHLPPLLDLGSAWERADEGLAVPVGLTVSGEGLAPFVIDLGATPHAVVAGTTGSGKSELLTSWLCQVAARYPPARVTMVLVDYKGGATFGPLTDLPHVLDVLTDLDHPATVRALESLRVEIHRRERLLQESGSLNLVEHNRSSARPLARLLIVVDEFRVLADEYPPLLEQLVRVAAQGRSLGIHVVLATQRPGGTMTADIRANMGVRVCLRVVEETDSIDLIGSPAAAHLPSIPGRMIVQAEGAHTVQTLWAGHHVDAVVEACIRAAEHVPALATTHRPWADPLPDSLPEPPTAPPGYVALGLADLPHEQRLAPWLLPLDARILVSGGAGSGRSTALRILSAGVIGAGHAVHTISSTPLLTSDTNGTDRIPAHLGSWIPPSDPPACLALLEALMQPGRDGLVVDDLDAVQESLDHALGPGEGPVFLQRCFQSMRRLRRFLAVSTGIPAPSWVEGFERVVFPPSDPHKRLLAGLTQEVTGPVGRGVALRDGRETMIQVAQDADADGATRVSPPQARAPAPEFLIRPLPTVVELPAISKRSAAATASPSAVIGIGGVDHGRVELPLPPGAVTAVIGPAGSGRSNLLEVIVLQVSAAGAGVSVRVVDDVHRLAPEELDELEREVAAGAHLVVALTPEGRASLYHPLITRLRHAQRTVLLGEMSRAEVGVNLGRYITPNVRGRGVLAGGGTFLPVQIYAAPSRDRPS